MTAEEKDIKEKPINRPRWDRPKGWTEEREKLNQAMMETNKNNKNNNK